VILIQFGESIENGVLTNPVGMSMRSQKFYPELRNIVKEHFNCIIGAVMANKVIVMVPTQPVENEYEERLRTIEQARRLLHALEKKIDAKFRIGIGHTYRIEELNQSYHEAYKALQEGDGRVIHVGDMPLRGEYEGEYPVDCEKLIFQMVIKGDTDGAKEQASIFFDWMVDNYPEYMDSIRLKVLELVMRAEKDAFYNGGINYGFLYRKDYLSEVLNCGSFDELRRWWLNKITDITRHMANRKQAQSKNIVTKAISYMEEHYKQDISLDEVARGS
jgi:two-component system, response regulator YesN